MRLEPVTPEPEMSAGTDALDPIRAYYDRLAPSYDADRFGNSYGQTVHLQEARLLRSWLGNAPRAHTLDLACGTGRLLSFAGHGADTSAPMLTQARQRWPDRHLHRCDARALPLPDASLDAVFCAHLLMHLPANTIGEIGQEVRRVLRPGGMFILDFPSALRRRLRPRPPPHGPSWHGSSQFTREEMLRLLPGFELEDHVGILLLPIQRLPARLRRPLAGLDRVAGRLLPDLACYSWFRLRKPR